MITIDILEQSGYKKYYDHLYASSFWQKRVWDVNGITTLYFINLHRNTLIKNGYQWELKLAFDSKSKFANYCWLTYGQQESTNFPLTLVRLSPIINP